MGVRQALPAYCQAALGAMDTARTLVADLAHGIYSHMAPGAP